MKKIVDNAYGTARLLLIALIMTICTFSVSGETIIGGTSPFYVLNGSFESVTNWVGNDTSSALAADLGIEMPIFYRNLSGIATDGTIYSLVGKHTAGEIIGIYMDTGYIIQTNDTFDLSFWYGDHNSSLESGESLRWQLFTTTTDDDSGVVDTVVSSGVVVYSNDSIMNEADITGTGVVTPSMVGKKLFISFLPDGLTQSLDWMALDQVNLSTSSFNPDQVVETVVKGTSPYILDGSFEAGSDGNPVDWLGNDTSSALASDLGFTQSMAYRSTASPSDGSQYAVVGNNAFGIYLDTGYTLAGGDKFDLIFWHGNHQNAGGKVIYWQLFTTTTGNDSGIVKNVIASGQELCSASSSSFEMALLNDLGPADSSYKGENLFLSFFMTDSSSYAGIDEVSLTATYLNISGGTIFLIK